MDTPDKLLKRIRGAEQLWHEAGEQLDAFIRVAAWMEKAPAEDVSEDTYLKLTEVYDALNALVAKRQRRVQELWERATALKGTCDDDER